MPGEGFRGFFSGCGPGEIDQHVRAFEKLPQGMGIVQVTGVTRYSAQGGGRGARSVQLTDLARSAEQ